MKFLCDTATLSEACQNVQRVASTKTSIPAVEGILIKAVENKVLLTGYDLEVGINTSVEARVEEFGGTILNAKYLCGILKKMPDSTVSFESDERQITYIRSGEVEFSFIGMSPEEYPELPSVTGCFPIVIDKNILRDMVRQTIFSVAVNDSRVVHTGIKFEIGSNSIRLIAVDGFRLAIRHEALDYDGEDISFIVPAKSLSEVVKLIGDGDSYVSLGVGKRHIVFEVGSYTVVSRLLDGEFLNYRTAIPNVNTTSVKVDTNLFIDSLDRTSLFLTDKTRCQIDNNEIRLSIVTTVGSEKDRIPAEVTGNAIEIGFNSRYILDALRACGTDEVRLEFNGAVSPILILPNEGDSFLYLILPVRL